MIDQIKGLHHVTSLASTASRNNTFFTRVLGLRRIKTTVNFDAPDVYHLYYGDEVGSPGGVMTYFPFPDAARGRPGTGEVRTVAFSVPMGSLAGWQERLAEQGVTGVEEITRFGQARLHFEGPDGEGLALVENEDGRTPWAEGPVAEDMAIRGFHSVDLRLAEAGPTAQLLDLMGYEATEDEGTTRRFRRVGGNGAEVIDLTTAGGMPRSQQGAGSVHHIAFAVANRARQLEVREALVEAGHQVTEQIDRQYFWAIYFRSPGGVLFEVATDEPGFATDEDRAHLGETLQLPPQHEQLRPRLEKTLEPLGD